ncbi:MAG: ATP-dependent zinc metalloprotease FtsH [Candidatus Parcubacteria bacterium]|nr:MAG: ATP-dependent zinc metalloprotease FtsH [Candidatus Parcubacteria bacterium]
MDKKIIRYIIVFILTIFTFFILSGFFFQKTIKNISLIELKNLIENNKVKHLYVNPNNLLVETYDNNFYKINKENNLTFWQIAKDLQIATPSLLSLKISSTDKGYQEIIVALIINLIPVIVIIWLFWYMFSQAQKGAGQIFSFSRSGIKAYDPRKEKITFDDVAGLKEAKEELQEIIDFLKNPQKFLSLGARVPKGVLLVGPPGTGKTLLAKATAAEASVPFYYISGSEFIELFVGIGASRIRDAFSIAKKTAPSILFIDEIDSIGRIRGLGITGAHEEREQTLNQLLSEMDGFEKEIPLVVLAATNRPDVLDPALLRPGRFDRKIFLDLPSISEREEILKIHLKDKKIGNIDIRQIAERTSGFSGADLANLCNEAAILAARKNKKQIDQEDLIAAVEKVLLGPERKSKAYSKKEKTIAAYHEAGHAIVAHYLPNSSPVQKISIIARGKAGGYTLKTPLEEKSFYFKKEFLDELASILGGYAAEQIVFGDISTGASSDLKIATNLAKDLITSYGMSEKFGPVSLGSKQEVIYGSREYLFEKDYSEKTAEEIDQEIRNILSNALERAKKILEIKKDKLDKLAKILYKKETIEKKQFERIIGEKKGSLFNI